ncbi:hypothetical protein IB227_06510 [Stenotrophomonas sp. STM01]|uniref:hypothetical protein n=1 Tax=Stenotrophomonas sp. STM01 TaxID=2769278 RepID=UPI0017826B89|nr:hypothetical protein [Stenotrophomonas sp. STM01]MBD9535490.1 hypothetical protein [Stenotrophomonas sp. STM01]
MTSWLLRQLFGKGQHRDLHGPSLAKGDVHQTAVFQLFERMQRCKKTDIRRGVAACCLPDTGNASMKEGKRDAVSTTDIRAVDWCPQAGVANLPPP